MISYSQAGQDIFVLNLMKGQTGKFLDLGCFLPKKINNTYLLELNGWDGISMDIQNLQENWNERKTKFIQGDCLNIDYKTFLPSHYPEKVIDYLTLDMEQCGHRFTLLSKVMETDYRFKIITIEHDSYLGQSFVDNEKLPQRKLLQSMGYELICGDLSQMYAPSMNFEDWWVDPQYFDRDELNRWKSDSECVSKIFERLYIPYEISPESR